MALKFKCPYCREVIITQYLKIDEIVICKNCNNRVTVPGTAITTLEKSNILNAAPDEMKQSPASFCIFKRPEDRRLHQLNRQAFHAQRLFGQCPGQD